MDLVSKYNYVKQEDYDSISGPDWPQFDIFTKHQTVPDFVYNEIDTMLRPDTRFTHPSFCVLPFYGVEYPANTPCCLMPKGTNRALVQQEMLAGQRPTACQKCWSLEDLNIKSDRLLKNETLDFYTNRNLEDLFNECNQNLHTILHYKIDTNNVCNSTCVTCDSEASSAWAKLERANNIKPKKTWKVYPAEIDPKIDYANAKSISFRGGEPFLSDTNFYILEKLIENNNTNCFIGFVTNGSSVLTEKQKYIISKFSNVNFCFSIDGVGPVFEYLRYPLKFDQLLENIRYCRENGIIPSANFTISNLNILYYSETVQWFKDNQINFSENLVYSPSCFSPSALPKDAKQYILEKYPSTPNGLIQGHSVSDDSNFETFKVEIAKQDAWKNIQLKYYLPELANLIDQK